MNTVYAIPSFSCNLSCSHCNLRTVEIPLTDGFFAELESIKDSNIIYFGGEPLLNKELFVKCIGLNDISSVSTNLLLLDDEYSEIIKGHDIGVSTSWNPSRFTDGQYSKWVANLKMLERHGISCCILITLTEDLISGDLNSLLERIGEWDRIGCVESILFEHLVDYDMSKTLHQRCDDWLCRVHDNWRFNARNAIEDKVGNWNCDCTKTFTLLPNGVMRQGCPQYTKTHVLDECLTCKYSDKCKPCVLQHICSFPKKLHERVFANGQ